MRYTRCIIVIFAVAWMFAATAFADVPAIEKIRKDYQSIRSMLPRLSRAERGLTDYAPEGGIARAYLDGKANILLLHTELYGDSGKQIADLYYCQGALCFAYYETHHYNAPIGTAVPSSRDSSAISLDLTKSRIEENRFYFVQGELVRWIDSERKEVSAREARFISKASDIKDFAKTMQNLFNIRN